jgi:hypothetical protein
VTKPMIGPRTRELAAIASALPGISKAGAAAPGRAADARLRLPGAGRAGGGRWADRRGLRLPVPPGFACTGGLVWHDRKGLAVCDATALAMSARPRLYALATGADSI